MQIEDLIQAGQTVLGSSQSAAEEKLEHLEHYFQRFEAWYAENQAALEDGTYPHLEAVSTLSALHERILAFAQSFRTESLAEMKAHKSRGKGIMAYTDILPKKISVLKKHKG